MDDLERYEPDDDDAAPAPFTTSQIADALLGLDSDALDDITRRHDFVEKLARGYGVMAAGLSVRWSVAQIKKVIAEPEMSDIIVAVEEFKHDTVEYAIYRAAMAGNVQAQKMYALAKMPERGWVEKRTVEIGGQARVDVVHSVRQALQETLAEEGAIAALHAAALRESSVPAEVVE